MSFQTATARSVARSVSRARQPICSRTAAALSTKVAFGRAPDHRPSSTPFGGSHRSVHTLSYGADVQPSEERVYERSDYPKDKVLDILKNEKIAVIGYGPQGAAQAQNLRDTGVANVFVGVRENGSSWKQAMADGFVPGETLFSIEGRRRLDSLCLEGLCNKS